TPESGDDIQVMKSGVIEIADVFVVNKADRDGADEFAKNLNQTLPINHEKEHIKAGIVKTIATKNEGIVQLVNEIEKQLFSKAHNNRSVLWAEKAYQLILKQKMKGIDKAKLTIEIEKELKKDPHLNIYRFIKNY